MTQAVVKVETTDEAETVTKVKGSCMPFIESDSVGLCYATYCGDMMEIYDIDMMEIYDIDVHNSFGMYIFAYDYIFKLVYAYYILTNSYLLVMHVDQLFSNVYIYILIVLMAFMVGWLHICRRLCFSSVPLKS